MTENSADVFVIKSVLAGVVIVQFKVFAPRVTNVTFFLLGLLACLYVCQSFFFCVTMMFLKVDNKSLQPLMHHYRQPSESTSTCQELLEKTETISALWFMRHWTS